MSRQFSKSINYTTKNTVCNFSYYKAAILGIPATNDASTSTYHNPQTADESLGVSSTDTTIRGRKGLLFEGKKFTLKFERDFNLTLLDRSRMTTMERIVRQLDRRYVQSHCIGES